MLAISHFQIHDTNIIILCLINLSSLNKLFDCYMYIPSDVPQYPIPTVGARIFHDLKMQYKILHNKFLTDENLILESPCNFEKRIETTAIL